MVRENDLKCCSGVGAMFVMKGEESKKQRKLHTLTFLPAIEAAAKQSRASAKQNI